MNHKHCTRNVLSKLSVQHHTSWCPVVASTRSPTATTCTGLGRLTSCSTGSSTTHGARAASAIGGQQPWTAGAPRQQRMQRSMRSSAFSTCWDEQRLLWKSQAVPLSMLHRMVQPAYLAFRQQCRQPSAHCSNSSSSGSSLSRAAGLTPQQLQYDRPLHARLQQAPAQPACIMHPYGDTHSNWSSGSPTNGTVHSMHSMQATLSGPVTSSSSSISAAKAPDGLPGPVKPGKDGDEFGPNFGEAVVVLREDLPLLFQQEMRFHIYRDDITFRTPSLRYLSGLWKYRLLARGARWLGRLLYSDLSLNVPRMWQPPGNRRQLRVRWMVSGVPRLSMLGGDQALSTEVISTYTFDSQGKIYEHQVDQIIPPESPVVKLLEWLMERLQPGAVLQPQLPIPGMPRG